LSRPFLDAVNGGDIRMVQRRECLCFAFKPRQTFRVARKQVGKNLEGDVAIESRVAGAIDLL
jgi:hypothetical protein